MLATLLLPTAHSSQISLDLGPSCVWAFLCVPRCSYVEKCQNHLDLGFIFLQIFTAIILNSYNLYLFVFLGFFKFNFLTFALKLLFFQEMLPSIYFTYLPTYNLHILLKITFQIIFTYFPYSRKGASLNHVANF